MIDRARNSQLESMQDKAAADSRPVLPFSKASRNARPSDGTVLDAYMRDVGRDNLLSVEEERELVQRMSHGDSMAREQLIRSQLRFVVKIANSFAGGAVPLADLVSEGNIGLMTAVDKFDPGKGTRLSTYAGWWIRRKIMRALRNQGSTVRVPVHMHESIRAMNAARVSLAQALGRTPTRDEVAEKLQVKAGKVRDMESWARTAAPPRPREEEDEDHDEFRTLADEKARLPSEECHDRQTREKITALVEALPPRERDVLKYRYGLVTGSGETFKQVGQRMKMSHTRAQQIQTVAVVRLRRMLAAKDGDAPYADYRLAS